MPIVPADQVWDLKLSTAGVIGTPAGQAKDFSLRGDLSLAQVKATKPQSDNFRLQLKMKRSQNKLLSFFTESFPEEKNDAQRETGAFQEKGFVYFVNTFTVRRDENRVESKPDPSVNDMGDFQSTAMLGPLSLTIGMVQRALNSPKMLEEYYIAKEGPRKFYVTFRQDLNAAIDTAKGDEAFKFTLKLVNGKEIIPKLFDGSLRVNRFTRKVLYVSAGSNAANWAPETRESILGGVESVSIRMDLK